jgi:hypothetical protein
MHVSLTPEEEVARAAVCRAAALAAGDEAALRLLMHPDLRWTTFRGEVLGYEAYIIGDTRGDLRWRAQRLEDVKAAVVADTGILVRPGKSGGLYVCELLVSLPDSSAP